MNCSLCGEVCRCHLEPPPSALPLCGADAEAASVEALAESCADSDAWRDELSVRLGRYRSRRKVRPPRYPSLQLPFNPVASFPRQDNPIEASRSPVFETVSNHALALDTLALDSLSLDSVSEAAAAPGPDTAQSAERGARSGTAEALSSPTAKIIEFPRFAWNAPRPPADQLAEPVSELPRILEVPESVLPPPCLGGITIESAQRSQVEKRPGIDTPLQSAPLSQRLLAATVDAFVVAAATALFACIFWKIAAIWPPREQLLWLPSGVFLLLWAGYQYLLTVYGGTTPGMRLAGLRLKRFDGSATRRSLRRWRVLASFLSAASLGMGYAWVFLDEDILCWHDRITHTYMAPADRAVAEDSEES